MTKKFFFIGMLFAALTLSFSACGDNNDPEETLDIPNLQWEYIDNARTLKIAPISGTAEIPARTGLPYPWDKHKSQISTIIIEDGITAINTNAFFEYDVKEVILPTSLVTIGVQAFENCKWLNKVHTATSTEDVDLVKLTKLKKIGMGAFSNTHIAFVLFPNSLTEIGTRAFYDCPFLVTVNMNSIKCTMGEYVFEHCSALKTVYWSNQMTTVPKGTFIRCGQLETLNSFTNVKIIGEEAFQECYHLYEITLGSSLTTIADYAFYKATALKDINLNVADKLTSIGKYAFYGCDLFNIVIPANVATIGRWAFYSNTRANLEIKSTKLKKIENATFYKVGNAAPLFKIDIPSCVETIGDSAFLDTYNDKAYDFSITCRRVSPPDVGKKAFNAKNSAIGKKATLRVPADGLNSYKANSDWLTYFTVDQIQKIQ